MYLSNEAFRQLPATHIVGLGKDCATAYNLRRYFNFGGAFPCDWWVVTDCSGLVRFLENPCLEALYDPSKLELTQNSSSVRHLDYDFLFHHEFPRDWSAKGAPVREDWRSAIARPRERTAFLLKKFKELNTPSNRVAFVRNGNSSNALMDALTTLFPEPELTFIKLNVPNSSTGGPDAWKGDPLQWDQHLSASGLTLDRSAHRPFSETLAEPTRESLLFTESPG